LRFTLLTVTSSQRDLHPQVCAHAGRTKAKATEVAFGPCDEAAGFVRLVFYI
jgi:hypothetical protein